MDDPELAVRQWNSPFVGFAGPQIPRALVYLPDFNSVADTLVDSGNLPVPAIRH